ncbi:MAG TPA: hypothetical protein DEA08_36015, partial [Planctomycetes bacterium]|nr:hypothetical protein [Planctomycetota bacterium]
MKSAHHTSLGALTSAKGFDLGGALLRRRCGLTRPCRLRIAAIVLVAGASRSGRFSLKRTRSFAGPRPQSRRSEVAGTYTGGGKPLP